MPSTFGSLRMFLNTGLFFLHRIGGSSVMGDRHAGGFSLTFVPEVLQNKISC
jgi:hypothetical protein